ncbi:MAG TPA: hypothetical protein VIG99_07395, partial [Myxococcaceae bacterium]
GKDSSDKGKDSKEGKDSSDKGKEGKEGKEDKDSSDKGKEGKDSSDSGTVLGGDVWAPPDPLRVARDALIVIGQSRYLDFGRMDSIHSLIDRRLLDLGVARIA